MKIIASAPTRISLFGGGTDLPIFYEKHGGLVVSMAINLYQCVEIANGGSKYSISMPENGSVDFYKAFFEEFNLPFGNFNIKASSDAPIQSGLGSSAAASVALVAALSRIKGQKLTRYEIAEKAWEICNNKLGLYSGKQDEYAASFGGYNKIVFNKDGTVFVNRLEGLLNKDNLLLFDTGLRRTNPKIQENFKTLTPEKEEALLKIKEIAENYTHWTELPHLLRRAWEEKKKSNTVSTPEIDEIEKAAIAGGAEAFKLLGSGGGGFCLVFVEEEKQEKVKSALKKKGCTWYDWDIYHNGVETRIL